MADFSPVGLTLFGDPAAAVAVAAPLARTFLVPPFSILDSRSGDWRSRKAAWLALGIQSELGRGSNLGGLSGEADVEFRRREGKYARTYRQDLMRDGTYPKKGLLMKSDSGRDPVFYQKKRDTEAQLGRELTTAEFIENYYESGVEEDDTGLSASGTSVFDPLLCELVYRWFCPPGGRVLDPFAGGSVRGVIAGLLGHPYTGIDLAERQIEANREQWRDINDRTANPPVDPTPIEEHGGCFVKRDDLFRVAGVSGGKARTAYSIAREASAGLVTAGARQSPQVNIVARIGAYLGLPVRVHVPSGELTPELRGAEAAGAELVQHSPGYTNVISARAREDAAERGWTLIPFGMEDDAAVRETRAQVRNLPLGIIPRIVVPVGSGMTLAGILWGLVDAGRAPGDPQVIGVRVGADPEKRLEKYAPPDWRERASIIEAWLPYEEEVPEADSYLGDLRLDPVYEAKALPVLDPGDLLWAVGIRQTVDLGSDDPERPRPRWIAGDSGEIDKGLLPEADRDYDLVFSCPPYYDLEVYSDHPRDLSNLPAYTDFLESYRAIIAAALGRLAPDRFAVFVVGDLRDRDGFYRGLVADTISAFRSAGAPLYNEAILVNTVGSLPVRVTRQFEVGRKLGKTHQNVLVFYNGDPARIREVYGQEGRDGRAGAAE